jgi:starch phosphorylase
VLDGWWVEGYGVENGWSIGNGEEYADLTYQDDVESRAIYDALEKEIVPLYYERQSDGLPRGWIRRMKKSIATIGAAFNTNRMVSEYATRFYLPAAERYFHLVKNGLSEGVDLALWLKHVEEQWGKVKVESVEPTDGGPIRVGAEYKVRATVQLGELTPRDVLVELYHGEVDATGGITAGKPTPMTDGDSPTGGLHKFEGAITCKSSGQRGFAVRVRPNHTNFPRNFQPGLIRWG